MRDHRRFLNVRGRADNLVGLRLADDQTNPFKLDFPTVAPAADNDGLWDIEVPTEEVEMEEVSIEDKSLDQVVADLILDEEEAIEAYENAEKAVVANEEISEGEKDEVLAILDHIKEEEEEHIEELTELVDGEIIEIENDPISDKEEVEETVVSEVEELEEVFSVNPMTKDDLYDRLVNKGESVELDIGDQGYSREEIGSFSDGGYYSNSTISIKFNNGKFGVTEFYISESGDEKEGDWDFETESFDELWDEVMNIFKPEDLTEHVNEEYPAIESDQKLVGTDNAVVDCDAYTLVAHSEDEKPSKQVFIDLSGSSYALRDELTAAALADGHKKDEIVYFNDFGFADATKAAKQGHNVFLYTKDDDYKFNSELEKFPNVKIKIVPNLQ